MDIFEEARAQINHSTIESLFPGGRWDGNDSYIVRSPLRIDHEAGSFHINGDGLFYDFADESQGDLISLVSQVYHVSLKEAAEKIAGHKAEKKEIPMQQKKDKIPAQFPIPDSVGKGLNERLASSWIINKYGFSQIGWKYTDKNSGWLFSVVRFEKDNKKSVVPFYYGTDNQWHEGMPVDNNRPLFNLAELEKNKELPVLIVEGEKCASVQVPGYVVTTWSSGARSFGKTDFTPLKNRDVTIWPDCDDPGRKAAQGIQKLLPQAKILEILDKNEGWDIADAVSENINLLEFIEAHRHNTEYQALEYYRALGLDDEGHHFLTNAMRMQLVIPTGKFTTSLVQELAPASYWTVKGMVNDSNKINLQAVQDYLIAESQAAGYFKPEELYGAGVWRDGDDFVVNTGKEIVTRDGKTRSYNDSSFTKKCFLSSQTRMSDMAGSESSSEQGRNVFTLFEAQNFQSPADVLASFGWCMLAPFGGILEWRPHIWISGRRGTGKSWVLNNLIKTLCGDYAYVGTGKDSEAGIRRSLRTDARPVILDEMETLQKRDEGKITGILSLARNASCNGSGHVTITGMNGKPVHYQIRSCFCFASIRKPNKDAAVDSRIIKVELKNCTDEEMKFKREMSGKYLRECIVNHSAEYRRRIFHKLPDIMSDIDFLRNSGILDSIGDTRAVDQWAPLFAFWNAAVNDITIKEASERERNPEDKYDAILRIKGLIPYIQGTHGEQVDDENAVIEHILQYTVRTDAGVSRSMAECLTAIYEYNESREEIKKLIERYGISINSALGDTCICFAPNSNAIGEMLEDTPYSQGYDAMLRRNSLCLNPNKLYQIRQSGRRVRAVLFSFEKFVKKYLLLEEENATN